MKITAYAWPNGHVDIGDGCPKGALIVASGEDEFVREAIKAVAGSTPTGIFEVPGVAANYGKGKSLDALDEFRQRAKQFIERATWGIDPLGA